MSEASRTITLDRKNVNTYRDGFGRVFFDTGCKNSQEHILAPTLEGDDRRKCQVALEDLVPAEAFHRPGDIEITIKFTTKTEES